MENTSQRINAHVGRARQIADALDSRDTEKMLCDQFYAEWKAWEAEDPTRTMAAFDREIIVEALRSETLWDGSLT